MPPALLYRLGGQWNPARLRCCMPCISDDAVPGVAENVVTLFPSSLTVACPRLV